MADAMPGQTLVLFLKLNKFSSLSLRIVFIFTYNLPTITNMNNY